jgi:tRNA dimethylallyltransferase
MEDSSMKKPLIVIGGPTASGKTNLAVKLAHEINGAIISADSMQVYKYMDIGTAKPDQQEMDGIKHYLIDEFYPDEEFNVSIFKNKAKEYIDIIHSQGKVPILVGGTGFYIQAVVNDNDFSQTTTDNGFRDQLYEQVKLLGNDYLHNKLKEIDPVSATIIHPNNVKRVIRALEYYEQTGMPISTHNEIEKKRSSPYNVKYILLNLQREQLYNRINIRVDKMITNGLVEEVKKLLDMGYSENLVSMQGLGYKELIPYIKGDIALSQAVEDLKQGTRHFAKRQFTWFNRQCNGQWINVDELTELEILEIIIKSLEQVII